MVSFERFEPLSHLEVQREPEQAEFRTHGRPPGVQPRPNRREHADRMKELTSSSAAELDRVRESIGVISRRLLVLRLETIDVNLRETLERFNATIVEELREALDDGMSYRLLVQFADDQSLARFIAESDHYAVETDTTTALPPGMRRDLFNALESISTVTVEERTGRRLRNEGYPDDDKFLLDVDLWNPGADSDYFDLLSLFRAFVEARDGRIIGDPLRIPSMVLAKLEVNANLLNDLLQLDLVALIDLPPIPLPEDAFDILHQPLQIPVGLPDVPADGPAACIVDSGVVAGHPLLRGVVISEEDFDSGEGTSVDQNGHGTQVGGLVVYGDIARRMQDGDWAPRVNLHSAKVLKNEENPIDPLNPNAVFADEERVEAQLKRAIQYFHREYGCRVFNLSIGHSGRIYEGGRQLPWAELLDELAKTLDLVTISKHWWMFNTSVNLCE